MYNLHVRKGFTLIELLVVIAIIGLLATIAVVSLNVARNKSKATKVIGDVRQIRTALEMWYNDKGTYPTSTDWSTGVLATGGITYLNPIPTSPVTNARYSYGASGTSDYFIPYSLGVNYNGVTVATATARGMGI
ncbi:MAG: prepilin-type N-terminal cleavage/methylation domain-containing protein [Candidatus Falkowbacteria bacterium]